MKLIQVTEADEWTNSPEEPNVHELTRKVKSLDHQSDLMLQKLELWAKHAHGKVFTTTGMKSGMKLPKPVEIDPRKFLTWTLTHSDSNIVTKVYVDKNDPKIVLPIRALINRHNQLTNVRAEKEGRLIRLKTELEKLRIKAKEAKKP